MTRRNDSGVALIAALLMTALMSALIVGAIALTVGEQRSRYLDRDRTQAFEASHAGLEKLTNDLGDLFTKTYAPTPAQITALQAAAPSMPGVIFAAPGQAAGTGYTINQAATQPRTLTQGPYSGLTALVTPYTIDVTARTATQSEVSLERTVNTVSIPVFQFGIFSDTDLSWFPGPTFNFGGRVHTNGNLFLAKGTGSDLILGDRVTAWGDVVRKFLSNGEPINPNYLGNVRIITVPGGCGTQQAPTPTAYSCRPMLDTEGSVQGKVGSLPTTAPNTWSTISTAAPPTPTVAGFYNKMITNRFTEAKKLNLPLAGQGAKPIDLIARPPQGEDTTGPIFSQRFFQYASLRILVADAAIDITKLPTVTATAPLRLDDIGGAVIINAAYPAIAKTGAVVSVPGYIKIEKQNAAGGVWTDVTTQILQAGYVDYSIKAGCAATPQHPNAILRFQRAKRTLAGCTGTLVGTDYGPLVLYDAREGNIRDDPSKVTNTMNYEGVMQYMELDINKLRTWLVAQGANIMQTTGYVVYFSDRRGSHDKNGNETGELNFEDVINPAAMNGAPNSVAQGPPPAVPAQAPDPGEDINGNGVIDVSGYWTRALTAAPTIRTAVTVTTAETASTPFFRRALKLVNGDRDASIIGAPLGLTVASENPVYIQGDYNGKTSERGGALAPWTNTYDQPHTANAVIADAVTLLSNGWTDLNSLLNPNRASNNERKATETVFRVAIISGKGMSFDKPAWGGCVTANATYPAYNTRECPEQDFGTDGGTHNFLRFLEDWGGIPLYYRGSMVSFFYSVQATGTFKCCNTVYGAPSRQYTFDTEFLTPSLLPPRTPMVRDINTTSFTKLPGPTNP